MKKLLFALSVLLFASSVSIMAQSIPPLASTPVESKVVFFEDFDSGHTIANASGNPAAWFLSTNHNSPQNDWKNGNYSHCIPANTSCLFVPNYRAVGTPGGPTSVYCASPSDVRTPMVPTSEFSNGFSMMYIEFDHIAKVHIINQAYVYVQAVGINGDPIAGSGKYNIEIRKCDTTYTGTADSIGNATNGGRFHQNSYTAWQASNPAAVPTSAWWRHERLLIPAAKVAELLALPGAAGLRVGFYNLKASSCTQAEDVAVGWYVDNIKITLANSELTKPSITLSGTIYNNVNANGTVTTSGGAITALQNKLGPYTITALLKDNQGVNLDDLHCYPTAGHFYIPDSRHTDQFCIDTLAFSWTKRCTAAAYNVLAPQYVDYNHAPTSWYVKYQSPTSTQRCPYIEHRYTVNWTIPKACYGDTISYTIKVDDIHGNFKDSTVRFMPFHNYINLATNDAKILTILPDTIDNGVSYAGVPLFIQSNNQYPIRVKVQNKSANRMTQIKIGWEVRGEGLCALQSGNATFTGDLCLDWDTIVHVGNFTACRGFDTICVWIMERNGQPDNGTTDNMKCIYRYACDSALAGTYTLGNVPTANFQSMQQLKTAFEKCGISGPVVINMDAGTWSEFNFNGLYNGQSATNTITFQKNPALPATDTVTIVGGTLDAAVLLENTGHFIFNNLKIVGNTTSTMAHSRGVYFKGTSPSVNIKVTNSTINVVTPPSGTTNANLVNYSGIVRSVACTATGQTGTVDSAIVINNNKINGGAYGIYHIGSTAKKNGFNKLDNNTISNPTTAGIFLSYLSKCTSIDTNTITGTPIGISLTGVTGNRVNNNTINVTNNAVVLQTSSILNSLDNNTIVATSATSSATTGIGISTSGTSAILSLSFNNIHAQNGIMMTSSATTANQIINGNRIEATYFGMSFTTVPNAVVSNNEVIDYISANTQYGVALISSNALKFINNSVLIYSTVNLSDSRALSISAGNNLIIRNNIIYNKTLSQNQSNYPIYINSTLPNPTFAYNDYFSAGGVVGYSTVARNNLSEWIYAFPQDTLSISKDPVFPNYSFTTNRLKLTDWDDFECATVLPEVPQDIEKATRNINLTAMGCYKGPDPDRTIDIALIGLVSPDPSSLGCVGATTPIVVKVRNTGVSPINFATTSATVQVTVTRQTGAPLNYSTTINTGTLAPLGFRNVTVAPAAPLPLNDNLFFNVVVTLGGDVNAGNNTYIDTVVLNVISPYYEEAFYLPEQFNNSELKPIWKFQQLNGNGNWKVEEASGVNPPINPVYGTGRLYFNSKNFATGTKSRAIMPLINLAGTTNPVIEFWMARDNTSTGNTNPNPEGITLTYSIDGGATWVPITAQGQSTSFIPRYLQTAAVPTWFKYTVSLSSLTSNACILFAFEATGKIGNNINIDRVVLRDKKANDLAIEAVYALGEDPADNNLISQKIKVRVANVGTATQTNVPLKLEMSGANSYTQTITIPTIAPDIIETYTFNGQFLANAGANLVTVSLAPDNFTGNDTMRWNMLSSIIPTADLLDTSHYVNYANMNNNVMVRTTGGVAGTKFVNRYVPSDTLIALSVQFYPVNAIEAVGKQVRAFISNAAGATITTSDIYTIQSGDVNSWVSIPLHNVALTSTKNPFYAGIELIDGGNYIGSQVEAPIRDSAYYTLSGTTYSRIVYGKTMIGAEIHKPIKWEVSITSVPTPTEGCDLCIEPISISITNNGYANIPAGTITFNYCINNGTIINVSYPEVLQSHQSTTFTLGYYDFTNNTSSNQSYCVKIWVSHLTQDIIMENDTITSCFLSKGKAPVPSVITPVTGSFYLPATLTATYPSGQSASTGVINWFTGVDIPCDWQFEGRGTPFNTYPLFYDTTFYATFAAGSIDVKTVGTGTTSNAQPMVFNTAGYSRGRILYTQSDLGRYGTISQIALDVASAANAAGSNGIPIKIYIKQVDYSTFPTGTITWANEIADATLVYEGSKFFGTTGWVNFPVNLFEYTSGNLLILTETNCGGTNCGTSVSGSTVYPAFRCTSTSGRVQYFIANNTIPVSGTATNGTNRWNMKFSFDDLDCQSQKVPVAIIVPRPTYDVETENTLLSPTPGCAMGPDYVTFQFTNKLNVPIPAEKVVVKAAITGKNATTNAVVKPTQTLIDTIHAPIALLETVTHQFSEMYDFSAPTVNLNYEIVLSTDLIGEATIYRMNDTLRVTVLSNQTDPIPDTIAVDASAYYSLPYILNPDPAHPVVYFYHNQMDPTPFFTSSATNHLTIPQLMGDTMFWITIKSLGTGTTCVTRKIPYIIHVQVPAFDTKTMSLAYPTSYVCGVLNPQIQVVLNNMKTDPIPAGTVKIVANFTSVNPLITGNQIVNQVLPPGQTTITFTVPMALGSVTQNRIYNYTIYTEPVTPQYVYTLNDTIQGTLFIPATPASPTTLTFTAPYGEPYTVNVSTVPFNMFTFYDQITDGSILGQGNSFVTAPIYNNPTYYYYSGQIRDNDFGATTILGTGTAAASTPFNFGVPVSKAKMLYTATELGTIIGRIDTISVYVNIAAVGGNIPIKVYIKDANGVTALTASNASIWAAETATATLIYDDAANFNQAGWFNIAIPGGFPYNGQGILLYAEHNCVLACGTAAGSMGISTLPTFRNTSNSGKVIGATTANFTLQTTRWNTKFRINYACESPRGTIIINPTSPPIRDVEVVSISSPITPNANYSSATPVTYTLKNHGTMAASGFTVNYLINDGAHTVQTESYSGSIASGATAGPLTFTTNVDLSSVYYDTEFIVFITWTQDGFHGNDTAKIMLKRTNPCFSSAIQNTGADISRFVFAGIDNGPGLPTFGYTFDPAISDGRYTDYTQSVAPAFVIQGQPYPFSITASFSQATGATTYRYVYIDLNRDGTFTANEQVYASGAIATPTSANPANATPAGTTITIPDTAHVGLTKMRVILSQAVPGSPIPCNTYLNGETEDYAVYISDPMPIDLAASKVLHPNGAYVCADNDGKVIVRVKNWGTTAVQFSPTNPLIVNATVTGPASGTYSTTITDGVLAPKDTMTVKIPGVNYSAAGTYNVKAYLTKITGDTYQVNDTVVGSGQVTNTNIAAIPYIETFEQNADTLTIFPQDWYRSSSQNSMQWRISMGILSQKQGGSIVAGPAKDNTDGGWEDGKFASVRTTATTPVGRIATLTTGCINFHYDEANFPKMLSYFEHIFGVNTAIADLKVQIGSGNYYETVDSIYGPRTQNSAAEYWKERIIYAIGMNENARLRFEFTKQAPNTAALEPAIDDISVIAARPDIALDGILVPDTCVYRDAYVVPVVNIKNTGGLDITSCTINGTISLGSYSQTLTKVWNAVDAGLTDGVLKPNQSTPVVFDEAIVLPTYGSFFQFTAEVVMPYDKVLYNNIKTVVPCILTDINDPKYDNNGVFLGQNIPNPTNGNTVIPFILPEFGKTIISVYSIEGQRLHTAEFNGVEGENNYQFDVMSMADGIYIYTLEFKGVKLFKKMVVKK